MSKDTQSLSAFKTPRDVVRAGKLSLPEKLAILKRWEQAELDIERATSEGMEGARASRLDEINEALLELDRTQDATEGGIGRARLAQS